MADNSPTDSDSTPAPSARLAWTDPETGKRKTKKLFCDPDLPLAYGHHVDRVINGVFPEGGRILTIAHIPKKNMLSITFGPTTSS